MNWYISVQVPAPTCSVGQLDELLERNIHLLFLEWVFVTWEIIQILKRNKQEENVLARKKSMNVLFLQRPLRSLRSPLGMSCPLSMPTCETVSGENNSSASQPSLLIASWQLNPPSRLVGDQLWNMTGLTREHEPGAFLKDTLEILQNLRILPSWKAKHAGVPGSGNLIPRPCPHHGPCLQAFPHLLGTLDRGPATWRWARGQWQLAKAVQRMTDLIPPKINLLFKWQKENSRKEKNYPCGLQGKDQILRPKLSFQADRPQGSPGRGSTENGTRHAVLTS